MVTAARIHINYQDSLGFISHFRPALAYAKLCISISAKPKSYYYSTFTPLVPSSKILECPPGNNISLVHSKFGARTFAGST